MTLAELLTSGELDGFEALPPRGGLVEGPLIDAAICAGATCGACGHDGLGYRPFTKACSLSGLPGRSYRAFAECPACGRVEEF